jgi:hypothetical protein
MQPFLALGLAYFLLHGLRAELTLGGKWAAVDNAK